MREILFRGKKIEDGKWLYGTPIFQDNEIAMVQWGEKEETFNLRIIGVIPETVGQFTGLCDADGKRIFEGDILGEDGKPAFNGGNVYWCNELSCFGIENFHASCLPLHNSNDQYEIIGNIHDHTELDAIKNLDERGFPSKEKTQ